MYSTPDFTLRGSPSGLAYKEFTANEDAQRLAAEAAIKFREGLPSSDRADLDEWLIWPQALVVDDQRAVCGLIMPLLDDEFFCDQLDPDTEQLGRQPRSMNWLASSANQRKQAQVNVGSVARTDRLAVLAQLVYAIALLHKFDWVFGDISFNNVVFTLDPPRIAVIDCDAAASLSNRKRQQGNTLAWEPPEFRGSSPQKFQDHATDVYKLGLAILRCMTPGKGAATRTKVDRLVAEVDAAGVALVGRALSADRVGRPKAKELYAYLASTAASRMDPPHLLSARLDSRLGVRGQDLRIHWLFTGAENVTVVSGNGDRFTVLIADHPDGVWLTSVTSGHVSLIASNKYSCIEVNLGLLTIYDLPDFTLDVDYLPRPSLPGLHWFSAYDPATNGYAPLVPVGKELPAIPPLDVVHDLLDQLAPAGRAPADWPALNDIIVESAQDLRTRVLGRHP